MTAGLAQTYSPTLEPLTDARPPVLVLGVGNILLQDDAAGLRMLQELSSRGLGEDIEYIDGGTMGLTLLGRLAGRQVMVVLDAVALGAEPGTIHVLRGVDLDQLRARRSSTSHESKAVELLAYAQLLGYEPQEVVVVGIEPESIKTGIGLNRSVLLALPAALAAARGVIKWARSRSAAV